MTRTLPIVAACLLFPGVAVAQYGDAPSEANANLQGATLSAGVGYGTAFGEDVKNDTLSDSISGQIPLEAELGYRVNPLFSFGLTFQYAFLMTKNCASGESCSASDTSLGFAARLHFATDQSFSPWISAGLGYEWLSVSASAGGQSMDMTLKGLEYDFQVGGDFRVNPIFTLGPFFGVRVGNYGSGSLSITGQGSGSGDIPDANQGTHGWLTFGLRGTFTL